MAIACQFVPFAFLVALVAEPALAEPCRSETFKDNAYIVCSFDLSKTDLRLFWRNADGAPFGTFTALAGYLEAEGDKLQFAMNAGMYDEDYRPMGLYVEGGKELTPVNKTSLSPKIRPVPNFFKKPNGVFYFGSAGAGVLTTEAFLAAPAEGGVRYPVRPDAGDRRRDPPGLHTRVERPQGAKRRRHHQPDDGPLRDQRIGGRRPASACQPRLQFAAPRVRRQAAQEPVRAQPLASAGRRSAGRNRRAASS